MDTISVTQEKDTIVIVQGSSRIVIPDTLIDIFLDDCKRAEENVYGYLDYIADRNAESKW